MGRVRRRTLTVSVTVAAVIGTGSAAFAAPYYDRPPSVQIGWTDAATPGTPYNYDARDRTDLPIGTWKDGQGGTHTTRVYATFDLSAYEGKKVYGGSVFVD